MPLFNPVSEYEVTLAAIVVAIELLASQVGPTARRIRKLVSLLELSTQDRLIWLSEIAVAANPDGAPVGGP